MIFATTIFPALRKLIIAGGSLCLLSACLRYTPSRSEMEKDHLETQTENLGSAQEFFAYEASLKDRVQRLVEDRAALNSLSDDQYRVGRGDIFDFSVFGLPELTSELEVSQTGSVSIPLLGGDVPVNGKTIYQMRQDLQYRLARFVRNPRVQLTIKNYAAHRVAVNGAVGKPGIYPLRRTGQTIAEVLAEAGGRTERAGNRVLLMPAKSPNIPQGQGVEIDYEDLLGSINNPPIQVPLVAGDTIIIPEAGTYEVDGEVDKPGSYKIAGRTSVMSAIAASGGFTYSAKVEEIEVIRDIGAGRKAFVAVNLEDIALGGKDDVRVRDGDLIRVPSASGRHARRQIVEAINGIFRGVGVTGRMN